MQPPFRKRGRLFVVPYPGGRFGRDAGVARKHGTESRLSYRGGAPGGRQRYGNNGKTLRPVPGSLLLQLRSGM